ncbi:MAG: hypothetical protein PF638_11125 [Candidatus Delongbacteria bacterium]|jgi:hypothetical protein|nr:hypothetical protein [Candidatus Delongbacteria bacterium]
MARKDYLKMKALKQSIKSVPEKETDTPLLKSSISQKDIDFPNSLSGLDIISPLLYLHLINKRRHHV